jgi:hypothetical protein
MQWADTLIYKSHDAWRLATIAEFQELNSNLLPLARHPYISGAFYNGGDTNAEIVGFNNFIVRQFWSKDLGGTYAKYWNFNGGYDSSDPKPTSHYTWAVTGGDIAAVPAPSAVWLFGSALLGLAGFRKKK